MVNHSNNSWLESYIKLMDNTEPAKLFDKWVAYSVVASALRRKVSLQLGRLIYFPNIYVVLVAEPGVARKTQAIKYGVNFLNTIPEIRLSADSSTKEAMTDDIEVSGLDELMVDGTTLRHSSLNIISKEFESFLGQKKENTRMLTALTDLFDCPDDWSSRTRHGKSNKIINPWVNLLAATTPDSLASSLPASAVGGGLTSRIMFIWADKKKKSVAIPFMTEEELKLKERLEKDLFRISRISGNYTMTSECIKKWTVWYDLFDEDESGERICKDKSFSGWYSRKPTYIIKIAMLRAAAEYSKLVIEWHHVEEAIEAIREVEYSMGNAFKAIGKSEISAEVDNVLQIIREAKCISEKVLMTRIWRDIDAQKFQNVIDTLIKTGKVIRTYKGPKEETGVWYWSTESKKDWTY
jgi:hypothetical protein